MKWNTVVWLIALCLVSSTAFGYVQPVHRHITEHAYDRLTIDFTSHFGLRRDQMIAGKTPRQWMSNGADEEDDFPRSVNHFFDPVHGSALTVPLIGCAPLFTRADQWAIDPYGNGYSVAQAKLHYAQALIGSNPGTRDSHWEDLFLSLGHEVHLLQDMAQPEHTRNDQHLPGTQLLLGNGYEASLWEEWGAKNLKNHSDPITKAIDPVVSFDGYPNVSLDSYYDYFHTASGKGLADFSNRSFVTQDTNYQDEQAFGKCFYYSLPDVRDAVERVQKNVGEQAYDPFGNPMVVYVDEHVFTSFPQDKYIGAQLMDPFHDFLSVVDLETRKTDCIDPYLLVKCKDTYSLGDGSYLSRASLLIPRAVGYSAGFVDHLFRGKIDAVWKKNSQGLWDVTITNLSAEPIGADARFAAVYRARPQYFERTNSDDTSPIIDEALAKLVEGFSGLAPGASVTVANFFVPNLKAGDELTEFERRIVVTGMLGNETAAVIGLVQKGDSAVDELKLEVSWGDLLPTFFSVAEVPFTSTSKYFAGFLAQYSRTWNLWPQSTMMIMRGISAPSPLNLASPSPAIFETSKVPAGKTFMFRARIDMGSFYWMTENLQVQAYVNQKLVKTFACPRDPKLLLATCQVQFTCQNNACTFTPIQ